MVAVVSEAARAGVSLAGGLLVGGGLVAAERLTPEPVVPRGDALLAGYCAFALLQLVLTWTAFGTRAGGPGPDRLGRLLASRARLLDRLLLSGEGPVLTVTLSSVALGAVVLLPRTGTAEAGSPSPALVVATVVLSWLSALVSYALHYAAEHAREPDALAFPGEQQPVFTDFVYFSLAVATTFGTTDVTVRSRRLRRSVTGHALVSFAWNAVILGLLVSALAA